MEYNPDPLRLQPRQRHDQIVDWDDIRLIRLVELELGASGAEERSDDVVYLTIRKTIIFSQSENILHGYGSGGLLHSQTMPRPLRKRDKVAIHLRSHVAQPALRDELHRAREDTRIAMRKIRGHADWDACRDHPLLELEGLFGGDSWTAVHRAVAQATCQTVSRLCSFCSKLLGAYRRASLINACRYTTFSSWAQVGFVRG